MVVAAALLLVGARASALSCSRDPPRDAPAGSASASRGAAITIAPIKRVAGIPKDLNVLLVSVDSLRADMPWNGYPRPICPRLTALERDSVSYTRAYSVSSYTSMSLGGLLAGRYPSELPRDGFFFGTFPKESAFFPRTLQKAGIVTLGAHAHGYFKGAGFELGFDRWELVPNLKWNNTTDENVTGKEHEAIAERMLSDDRLVRGRFFAWFHFLDPHDQYLSHETDGIPPYGASLRDRYDAEVLFTDRQIEKLLAFVDRQPWGPRTAIIVTADHGEAFGEHGMFSHGFEIWENLVRVPLFLHVPGLRPRRIDEPRSALDLAPTIVELMGLPPDPAFEGKSLVPELLGDPATPRDVLCDLPPTSDSTKRRALIVGHKKIIATGSDTFLRLYDLDQDPEEKYPITTGKEFEALSRRYQEVIKGLKEVQPYACGPGCLGGAYKNAAAPR